MNTCKKNAGNSEMSESKTNSVRYGKILISKSFLIHMRRLLCGHVTGVCYRFSVAFHGSGLPGTRLTVLRNPDQNQ